MTERDREALEFLEAQVMVIEARAGVAQIPELRHALTLARRGSEASWRPIETAPRDRVDILVQLTPDALCGNINEHFGGRYFVARHTGEGYWSLFPGFGGIPDKWLAGWMPLPGAPEGEESGEHG